MLSAILEYNDIGYLDLEDPSNIDKLNATVQTIIETLEDTEFYIEGCDENGIKL